jgi:ribonuclease P protein component
MPEQSFPRSNRLTDGESFNRVFKKASPSRDNMFTVLTTENHSRDARLGLAIAKKHCKLAVSRNRLKRIVRESFRTHRGQLSGLDIVVMNRPGTHEAGNKALHESLAKHWQKCGALRQTSQDR